MLRNTFLIGLTCCFNLYLFAQSNTVSTGNDANGSGGSVSYSVGQIDYTNQQASTGKISQGVQQPYEIFQTSGLDDINVVKVLIGPNPTVGNIIIQIDLNTLISGTASLFDVNGKLIRELKLSQEKTEVDLTSYAGGVYTLQIFQAQKPMSSFRIVKN